MVLKDKNIINQKTALITGGTNGIGEKLVHSLIDHGYFVYILSRKKKKKELKEKFRDKFKYITHLPVNLDNIQQTKKL